MTFQGRVKKKYFKKPFGLFFFACFKQKKKVNWLLSLNDVNISSYPGITSDYN